jgi:hypothetical protein
MHFGLMPVLGGVDWRGRCRWVAAQKGGAVPPSGHISCHPLPAGAAVCYCVAAVPGLPRTAVLRRNRLTCLSECLNPAWA